jgi:hypothetical protein
MHWNHACVMIFFAEWPGPDCILTVLVSEWKIRVVRRLRRMYEMHSSLADSEAKGRTKRI